MKKLFPIILGSFLLLLLTTGCGLSERYIRGMIGKQSDTTPVFMDNFTDHENGWLVSVTEAGVVDYDGESLRILIKQPLTDYWSTPGLNLSNVVVNVDTVRVTGPENNLFGLVCRYQDRKNYYAFLVGSDGYYGIAKIENGVRTLIGSDEMQVTDQIGKGSLTNHVRADCIGEQLTLYLNWNKLIETTDSTFSKGDVGIIASTLDDAGTDIRFDNFIVLSPKE